MNVELVFAVVVEGAENSLGAVLAVEGVCCLAFGINLKICRCGCVEFLSFALLFVLVFIRGCDVVFCVFGGVWVRCFCQ